MNESSRPNKLFLKNNYLTKNMQLRLTPIKKLKQTFKGMPTQNNQLKNNQPYTPQKLSLAITSKLKSSTQNSIKFQASVITPKVYKQKQIPKKIYPKSQRKLQNNDSFTQRKISNLLNFKKQKSHTMHSVSVPYANLLPQSYYFTHANLSSKHILKFTKLKQMYNYLKVAKKKTSKILTSQTNLTILSRRLTLLKQYRTNKSVNKTQASSQTIYKTQLTTRSSKKIKNKQTTFEQTHISHIIPLNLQNIHKKLFQNHQQKIKKDKQRIKNITEINESYQQTLEGWKNDQIQQQFQQFMQDQEKNKQQQKHNNNKHNIKKNQSLHAKSFHLKNQKRLEGLQFSLKRANTKNN